MKHFYAHGKLLLSGEYFVLDGAKALAIPTRYGQHLEVTQIHGEEGKLHWTALDENGAQLLAVTFALNDFKVLDKKGEISHFMLQEILRAARVKNPGFLDNKESIYAVSRLEFNPAWGLGSSSTLVYNIATWAQADAMELFFSTLPGSGYDVACAGTDDAILYQLENGKPEWHKLTFNPPFATQLYFIYLGKKQNSSDAVKKFRDIQRDAKVIEQISGITEKMVNAATASTFSALMEAHETLVADALHLKKAKDLYFEDFPGAVKSLGAWGGDFVMAMAEDAAFSTKKYFQEKGFETVFAFEEMVFKNV